MQFEENFKQQSTMSLQYFELVSEMEDTNNNFKME
jgi:hypothetical protein